jgi:hypothetical protein
VTASVRTMATCGRSPSGMMQPQRPYIQMLFMNAHRLQQTDHFGIALTSNETFHFSLH